MNLPLINIIIVDDHKIIIDGLKSILDEQKYSINHSCSSIEELLSILNPKIDIILLDINLNNKNALNYIDKIKALNSKVKIVLLTSYNSASFVKEAFEKKVSGYLLKDISKAELDLAIQTVLKGSRYISTNIITNPTGHSFRNEISDSFQLGQKLSIREKQIISLIASSYTSQQIAEKLFLSRHTVKSHRKNILKKLHLHNGVELVHFAVKNGLV